MAEKQLICISCKKRITNKQGSAVFPCPKCGKYEIVRCRNCRERAIRYKCPCGFEGPN